MHLICFYIWLVTFKQTPDTIRWHFPEQMKIGATANQTIKVAIEESKEEGEDFTEKDVVKVERIRYVCEPDN
jgi:hypothetical protein